MSSISLIASLAVFLCCLLVPAQLGSPCPPETDIIPCKCSKSGPDTIINCAYHDPALLKLAFDKISSTGTIVDFFNVSSTRLQALNSNFFEKMTVRRALLYGDRWSTIADDAFSGQEHSLAELTIQESLLTSVPTNAIGILEELEYLAMVNSEILAIEANAFDNLKSAGVLRTLDLSSNYIKTIGGQAFAKLTDLRTLILSKNEIRTIPAGVLPSSNMIKLFDASHNRIETIPADIGTLPYESAVNLNENKIGDISGVAIRTMVTNHLSVTMTDNELRCTCSMRILTSTSIRSIIGECSYPAALAGKSLTDLTSSDFPGCYNFLSKLLAQKMAS